MWHRPSFSAKKITLLTRSTTHNYFSTVYIDTCQPMPKIYGKSRNNCSVNVFMLTVQPLSELYFYLSWRISDGMNWERSTPTVQDNGTVQRMQAVWGENREVEKTKGKQNKGRGGERWRSHDFWWKQKWHSCTCKLKTWRMSSITLVTEVNSG